MKPSGYFYVPGKGSIKIVPFAEIAADETPMTHEQVVREIAALEELAARIGFSYPPEGCMAPSLSDLRAAVENVTAARAAYVAASSHHADSIKAIANTQ